MPPERWIWSSGKLQTFKAVNPGSLTRKVERQAGKQQGSGILAPPKGLAGEQTDQLLEETHYCYCPTKPQIWKRIGPGWNH